MNETNHFYLAFPFLMKTSNVQIKIGTTYQNVLERVDDNFFQSISGFTSYFASGHLDSTIYIRVYAVDGQSVDDVVCKSEI